MPYGKLETRQDCEDFVRGCLFMGTGGGGSVEWGMGMFEDALDYVGAELFASVLAPGAYDMGDVRKQKDVLKKARQAGRDAVT